MIVDFIRECPTILFVFMFTMPGLLLFAAVVKLVSAWKLATQTTGTQVGSIAEAHDGIVAIEGRVDQLLTGELTAPLSGKPCCWYRYTIHKWVERKVSGNNGNRSVVWEWQYKNELTSEEPLLIVDQTGTCAAWGAGADVYTSNRSIWYGDSRMPEEPPPDNDVQTEPSECQRRYRYVEERIVFGDEVYATGEVSHKVPGSLDPEMQRSIPTNVKHLVTPYSKRGNLRISQGSCGSEIDRHTEEIKKTFIVACMGAAGVLGLLLIRFGVIG